jgi:hypothetical protein
LAHKPANSLHAIRGRPTRCPSISTRVAIYLVTTPSRSSLRGEGEGNEGVERAASELERRPAVALIEALPELAVGETGEQTAIGREEYVGHRR